MSSAIYLENYLDGITLVAPETHLETYNIYNSQTGLESLPTELERNFKLMRKLDDRAQTAMKSIDSHAKDFMRKLGENGAMSDEERKERQEDIKALFGKAKEYSDDKVQLAIQTYELVDKQIRRLDNDLARFEGEIQEKASSTRAKSEEVVAKSMIRLRYLSFHKVTLIFDSFFQRAAKRPRTARRRAKRKSPPPRTRKLGVATTRPTPIPA